MFGRQPERAEFMSQSIVNADTDLAALKGSLKDYRAPKGQHIVERASGFHDWQDLRRQSDLWPYARSTRTAPQAFCEALSDAGDPITGVNFASQDYLGLSTHPKVKQCATKAIETYGVHSAGSAALQGNTTNSLSPELALSQFLHGREVVLYPTGWAAGYGGIQGFVRPHDHVVMDILAHSCLQEGARSSTQNVHYYAHLKPDSAERKLKSIRERHPEAGILLVTESLFSMHATTPDLKALADLCKTYKATFLVDCAHDFGAMGPEGLGAIGKYGVLDDVDVIVASFSKSFASNGGFVSVKTKAAAEYLKYYSATHTFSNALSPVQAATVLAALKIVASDEGKLLRTRLMENILALRTEMQAAGAEALGEPSPIVPIRVGDEVLGRLVARQLPRMGGIANLVEYPAVPRSDSRFRFQVMASHTRGDVDRVVKALSEAMRAGAAELEQARAGDLSRLSALAARPLRRVG